MLKTKYNTDKTELENKIPYTSGLVKKTNYNTKITELVNEIPDISNLATKTTLTAIENKIPSVSNLFKKTDYNTKITDIEIKLNNHNHNKYIDTSEFNKLAVDVFNVRLVQANLTKKKTDFDAKFFNRKVTQNKSKHLLAEDELNKLKTFDFSYFMGKSHFGGNGTQNYLVFQPMYRYFKMTTDTDYISSWKSKGLCSEGIKRPTTSDNSLTPGLIYYGSKTRVKFTGSCLKRSKIHITMEK